jgi:hypothetical protein
MDFHWPPAQTILENASKNEYRPVCIACVCTSVGYLKSALNIAAECAEVNGIDHSPLRFTSLFTHQPYLKL